MDVYGRQVRASPVTEMPHASFALLVRHVSGVALRNASSKTGKWPAGIPVSTTPTPPPPEFTGLSFSPPVWSQSECQISALILKSEIFYNGFFLALLFFAPDSGQGVPGPHLWHLRVGFRQTECGGSAATVSHSSRVTDLLPARNGKWRVELVLDGRRLLNLLT